MDRRVPPLAVLALAVLTAALVLVAPTPTPAAASTCRDRTNIPHWSQKALDRLGWQTQIHSPSQAQVTPRGQTIALDVAADPANGGYVAARITEINTSVPIADRTFCWKPTVDRDVEVSYQLRFTQAQVAQGWTQNMILWNAPMADPALPEPPLPLTAFGVSRSMGQYTAVVVQGLNLATFSADVYATPAMPSWLKADEWHQVDMRVAVDRVTIHVTQDGQSVVVADVPLAYRPTATGMEFSVDNEMVPGMYVPVTTPDGAEIAFYRAGYAPARP